ncbi:amiloride-sensitive sodium channel subunit delta [Serinus canaria]|uniref:amiloride-sensitive sodium channel subunit delta n=1 Tax=Serinus canaria TaxID=9135 RepID=UPI0021CCF4E2|nr:amiloride-sensitive sodium channel subunit delta [Serinus canaria]
MELDLPGGEGGGGGAEEGLIEFYGSFREMFEFFCRDTTIGGKGLFGEAHLGEACLEKISLEKPFLEKPSLEKTSLDKASLKKPFWTTLSLRLIRFPIVSHAQRMELDLPGEGGGGGAEEGLIEFYGSFREMFEFFCKHTTIHGTVRLVCSGRNRLKTAFWTLLLLASLAMLYWQFALMLSQFWAYPVVLTMSVDSEPKMFPAVTICNLDPSRFELVSEQLEQLERMAEESLTFLYGPKAAARLAQLRDRDRDRDRDRASAIRVQAWANLSSAGFRLSHNFSLVRMWEPRAGKKHSRVGFRLVNSTGGNCFFTSHPSGMDALLEWFRFHYMNVMAQLPPGLARHQQHFQDLVYSCQYDGEPCRPGDHIHFHHPVFGSCYTFNSQGTDPFWAATKPGIPYGLSLILRAEQKEHIPLLSTVAGVKVLIHGHNQTPFLEHEGFHIRPGIATTIGIRQDQVNRLGGNYGRCTMDGADVAVELLYNNSYTLQVLSLA